MNRRKFLKRAGSGLALSGVLRKALADADADAAARIPRWLKGKPINQWATIPNTSMDKMDFSAQIAAGLTNSAIADIGYGSPIYGMVWGDSGGCLKKNGSVLLLYGGGGAGAWAGNDIRGLTLEDDAPRWATIKKPSSAQNLWHCQRAFGGAPSDPSAPYLRDGKTPNPGHSYLQPHFVNRQNKFYLFGRKQTWERDTGYFWNVDSVSISDSNPDSWDAPGTHPAIPNLRPYGWDGWVQCGHPHTDDWYVVGNNPVRLAKWSVVMNAWSMAASDIIPGGSYDPQRGMPAIDPRGTGLMLVIGGTIGHPDPTGYNFVWVYDLATLSVQQGSLTGPYANRVTAGYWWAGGLVFDEGINKFVHCPDDGYLYTLERVGITTQFYVDRMALTVTGFPALTSSRGFKIAGWSDIKGRMRYVPKLKGIVIFPNPYMNAYFVKTSA